MKKVRLLLAGWILMLTCLLTGCQIQSTERIKLRDLDFTIQSEETIPAEVRQLVKEKMTEPFKFTFTDEENLYICVGYGRQDQGGYSIAVDALYLTDDAIYLETTLLGPGSESDRGEAESYPYIVIKTESLEKTVVCE